MALVLRSAALGLVLLALNLVLINVIAGRHSARTDWSANRWFSLSAKSKKVLEDLGHPVEVYAFIVPTQRYQESLYDEIRELLHRLSQHAPSIKVEWVDMDLDPARAEVLTRRFTINAADLRQGVVVFHCLGRSRYVTSAAMADYELSGGVRRLVGFKAEAAFLESLLAVTSDQVRTVCFTRDHGEFSAESYAEAGYGFIADEVRRDAFRVRSLGSQELAEGARGCQAIVIGGPRRSFALVELDALERYLRRGGRLLVLLGPVLDRRVTRHRRIGLEELLSRWGIQVLDNIVVDRLAMPGEQPYLTWGTRDGYGTHPIARGMAGRLTVWPLTREVRPVSVARKDLEVSSLVQTSDQGWAETDLVSLWGSRPLELDRALDTAGPVSVAVAASWRDSRLVVIGTDQGVLNKRLKGNEIRDFNRDFFMSCINWLTGQRARLGIGPKMPQQMRLALDQRQLSRVFLICVVGLPLLGLCAGLVVWWRRRR